MWRPEREWQSVMMTIAMLVEGKWPVGGLLQDLC